MTQPPITADSVAPPLDEAARRQGRRIAISSHPLGMTFSLVFTQHLPTLALVSLGASEAVVGLQSGLGAMDLLRLPALRAVSVLSKRTILIAGQVVALAAAAPLLVFPILLDQSRRGDGDRAVAIALISLIGVTAAVRVAETVWFPMLRSYVEGHADAVEVRIALTTVLRERGDHDGALAQAREVLVRDPLHRRRLLWCPLQQLRPQQRVLTLVMMVQKQQPEIDVVGQEGDSVWRRVRLGAQQSC